MVRMGEKGKGLRREESQGVLRVASDEGWHPTPSNREILVCRGVKDPYWLPAGA